jgi:transcriptional regulator with XRE-family HTH domain
LKIILTIKYKKGVFMMEGYGEFIRKHRIASGYKSQRRLADKCGISSATISRIEKEIQKPEARTLKTLAQYLETTSYVELMVVCGYWDKDELLDDVNYDPEEVKDEIDFVGKIELTDDEILTEFDFEIDGKRLSKEEAKGIIAYVRLLRMKD